MTDLIEVADLSKTFGTLRAVANVSFNVARGEVLGFLGPNGAGKSTTMKMITGFLEPTGGTARICGHDIQTAALAAKACIGYLPEGAPLYSEMTTRGFLDFIADVRGLARAARAARIDTVVRKIHLESVLDQRVETLSKGYKRRVGVAQAILHDPDVLVMDEPTDGLDPNQKHEVRNLIREMARDKAIVISTHILEEVDAVCSRVIIIAAGRLVFTGTPRELAARAPNHHAVRLTVRGQSIETLRARLETLTDVESILPDAGSESTTRVLIVPRPGASVFGVINDSTRAAGWDVEEIALEQGRLDDVFRTITTAAAGLPGAGA